MSVEIAFGILKARFKEIGTRSSLKLDFLPTVVHNCCVLHNTTTEYVTNSTEIQHKIVEGFCCFGRVVGVIL